MMMLPPKSGRKAVRLRNANTITTLSHVYREITSAWINDHEFSFADKVPQLRDRILGVSTQLQALRGQTMIAKFEGSFRGKWPVEEYSKLVDVQFDMLISLAMVSRSLHFLH